MYVRGGILVLAKSRYVKRDFVVLEAEKFR
jgi:hypothetical protein